MNTLNLGQRDDVTGAYAAISSSAFASLYSCDAGYIGQMFEDHYRVTDHAQSFVTSTNADDVIDSTGAGTFKTFQYIVLHVSNSYAMKYLLSTQYSCSIIELHKIDVYILISHTQVTQQKRVLAVKLNSTLVPHSHR